MNIDQLPETYQDYFKLAMEERDKNREDLKDIFFGHFWTWFSVWADNQPQKKDN